ncbi:hypothetical protein ACP4OV_011152 [Aristida adscensionis]
MVRVTPKAAVDDDVKTSWPEVMGWEVLNASIQINTDRPDVSTPFYMIGSPLPTDYDPKRVIIIFDERSVVCKTPVVS